jgi:hypothetical protein
MNSRLLVNAMSRRDDARAATRRDAAMHVKEVLQTLIAAILQRHVAAATGEIARAMTDEIEALALESGDEP